MDRGDKVPGRAHGVRESPGSTQAKPKTPIDRRGVSLISFADYPRGANASPVLASFFDILRGQWPPDASLRLYGR